MKRGFESPQSAPRTPDLSLPLPEGLDTSLGRSLGERSDPSACEFEEGSSEEEHALLELPWGAAEGSMLRARIEDEVQRVTPSLKVSLPWEAKVFKGIFAEASEEDLLPTPALGTIDISLDAGAEVDVGRPAKLRKPACTGKDAYVGAISFHVRSMGEGGEELVWKRSLEKWYYIFNCPSACPEGVEVSSAPDTSTLERLRLVFGGRSARTVQKRADSLLQYLRWLAGHERLESAFPLDPEMLHAFISESLRENASGSSLQSFKEAVNFAVLFLRMPSRNPTAPLWSLTLRMIEHQAMIRGEKKQAPPLLVSEVEKLEQILKDPGRSTVDRLGAGGFLFALYGRCR